MVERPRAGLELIALQGAGGRVELARRRVDGWNLGREVFSQRAFLASPDGERLVHAGADGELRVLGTGGERIIARAGGRDVRFSADGRHLAAFVSLQDASAGDLASVVVLDLAGRGEPVSLGQVHRPLWLEWVSGGVVVSHVEPANRPALTYFPLAGRARLLSSRDDLVPRFTAAARGTRVMFFAGRKAFTVDVSGGQATEVAELPLAPSNVEMTPDGGEAAIVTQGKLMRWSAAGLQELESSVHPHTVWYSADGRHLAYAWNGGAVLMTSSGQRHQLEAPGYDLRAMRFRRGGDGLVVVRGDRVLLWRPTAGDLRTLATAPAGQQLRGADLYRGGTVLWTLLPRAISQQKS